MEGGKSSPPIVPWPHQTRGLISVITALGPGASLAHVFLGEALARIASLRHGDALRRPPDRHRLLGLERRDIDYGHVVGQTVGDIELALIRRQLEVPRPLAHGMYSPKPSTVSATQTTSWSGAPRVTSGIRVWIC
jgi:hypothetical protein